LVKGDDIEDLIDLTIKDITLNGKSVKNKLREEGKMDVIYTSLINSKISEW
jgi:hypothetical protein